MDSAIRKKLIEQYKDGYRAVSEALAGLSDREVDMRHPGKWSVREIVHHLADSELVAAARLRQVVAEDRPGLRAADLGGYPRRLFYDRPIQHSLELFRVIRLSTAEILDRMTDAEWAREGIQPDGGRFTAEKWLEIFAQHAHTHAEQIRSTRAGTK